MKGTLNFGFDVDARFMSDKRVGVCPICGGRMRDDSRMCRFCAYEERRVHGGGMDLVCLPGLARTDPAAARAAFRKRLENRMRPK